MDDTYIDSDSPDTNFGAATILEVRPDHFGDRRSLLRFDLSAIPADASVTNGTLYLYQRGNQTGQTTFVYRITSDWSESTATWQSWLSPGGDFDGSGSYFSILPEQDECMRSMDITGLVQIWVDGTHPNYGLLLYATGPDPAIYYSSKESENRNEWPRLSITFTIDREQANRGPGFKR